MEIAGHSNLSNNVYANKYTGCASVNTSDFHTVPHRTIHSTQVPMDDESHSDSDDETVPNEMNGAMAPFLETITYQETRDAYARRLRQVRDWFFQKYKIPQKLFFRKFKKKHLEEFSREHGHFPGRVDGTVRTLKSLFNFLLENGVIKKNRLRRFKMKKYVCQTPRHMTDKHVRSLMKATKRLFEDEQIEERHKIFIGVLRFSGIRINEARHLLSQNVIRHDDGSDSDDVSDSGGGEHSEEEEVSSDSESGASHSSDDEEDEDDDESHDDESLRALRTAYYEMHDCNPPFQKRNDKQWLVKQTKTGSGERRKSSGKVRTMSVDSTPRSRFRYSLYVGQHAKKGSRRHINLPQRFGKELYNFAQKMKISSKKKKWLFQGKVYKRTALYTYKQALKDTYSHLAAKDRTNKLNKDFENMDVTARARYERAAVHDYNKRFTEGIPITKPGMHRWFKKIAQAAGLPREVSCHWVRHWYCTDALKRGVPLKNVQLVMGHKSAATTIGVYTRADPMVIVADEHTYEFD